MSMEWIKEENRRREQEDIGTAHLYDIVHEQTEEIAQLHAENERLKAELKSIDCALDDPRANLTLTTAEIIWEIKAELAEAKKDAERYRWLRTGPILWETNLDAACDAAMKEK